MSNRDEMPKMAGHPCSLKMGLSIVLVKLRRMASLPIGSTYYLVGTTYLLPLAEKYFILHYHGYLEPILSSSTYLTADITMQVYTGSHWNPP